MSTFRPQYASIKGISERRRLPRRGKIRLGVKLKSQKTGNEYPKEVDYFVSPSEVQAIYGNEPKELDVMFPVNDREVVFPQAYKWYGQSKGVKCIGDGETAKRFNEETGEFEEIKCPCDKLEGDKPECGIRAHLLVMLPAVNVGGVYQIDLGSYHSVVDINSGIDYVQAMLGRFALVPLRLKRIPRETHGSGRKETHYTLHVHLDADVALLNKLKEDTLRVLTGPQYALPPPEDLNPKMDNGIVEIVDEEDEGESGPIQKERPPLALEPTKKESPKDKKESWQSPAHIKVEALMKEYGVTREKFKEFLCQQEMLDPDDDDKLSMKSLSSKNAAELANKFEHYYSVYRMWSTKNAEE